MLFPQSFTTRQLIIVIVLAAALGAVLLPMAAKLRGRHRAATCATNLKQWGLILKMYESEAGGRFPSPARFGIGDAMPTMRVDSSLVYPDYWTDLKIAWCPGDSTLRQEKRETLRTIEQFADDDPKECTQAVLSNTGSYMYLYWRTRSEFWLVDLVRGKLHLNRQTAPTATPATDEQSARCGFSFREWPREAFDQQLNLKGVPGVKEALTLYRVKEITYHRDIWASPNDESVRDSIPLMLEGRGTTARTHRAILRADRRRGRNILFSDGHVEYVGTDRVFPGTKLAVKMPSGDFEWAMRTAMGWE